MTKIVGIALGLGLALAASFAATAQGLIPSSLTNANLVSAAPGAFSKVSPASGETRVFETPVFRWTEATGAIKYEICVDTSNDNVCTANIWQSNGSPLPRWWWWRTLNPNTTYYWQVRAVSSGGSPSITYADGSSTAFQSFTTGGSFENLLWSVDNGASLWLLSNGTFANAFWIPGPGTGWRATGYHRIPNYSWQVLWTSDNAAQVWLFSGSNDPQGVIGLTGPGPGWTATSYFAHPDETGDWDLLWTRDNAAQVWFLNGFTTPTFKGAIGMSGNGPGWTATSYLRAADGGHRVLWTNGDNLAQLWRITSGLVWDGAVGMAGPGPGWKASSYQLNADNSWQVAWTADDQAQIWNISAADVWTGMAGFGGPAPGWTLESYFK